MLTLADAILPRTILDITEGEPPARRHLIATGERLLGDGGFDGLAMHKVARAAGQANTYAVQYHFGNREGLIEAVFETRLRWLKQRRVDLLECARERGLLESLPALLEVLFLPLSEQVDEDGRHSYARFMLQHYARPLSRSAWTGALVQKAGPIDEICERIGKLAGLDSGDVKQRLMLLIAIALWALIDRDNFMAQGLPAPDLSATVGGTVAVVQAALLASEWPPALDDARPAERRPAAAYAASRGRSRSRADSRSSDRPEAKRASPSR